MTLPRDAPPMANAQTIPPSKKNRLSADAALKKLVEGNKRYQSDAPIEYQNRQERVDFERGQKPYAAILGCADSRVSPEILFNTGMDELFVLRVAGNIADTTSIASIEYAVSQLNTNLIVVMGHEACGAVGAALANANDTTDMGYNLNMLVSHIAPGIAAAKKKKSAFAKDPVTTAVKENARLSALELRKRSPIIANARGVKIVSAYYKLVTGKVTFSKYL